MASEKLTSTQGKFDCSSTIGNNNTEDNQGPLTCNELINTSYYWQSSGSATPLSAQDETLDALAQGQYSTLQLYLKRVTSYSLLSVADELATARQVVKGNVKARTKMINSNLRLVIKWAKRYRFRGLQLIDLVEEGNIGLIRAVDKFDPEMGFRFSTYASWWIRQAIDRSIMSQERMVRLPFNVVRELKSYLSTKKKLTQTLGKEASPKQIAKHLDVSTQRVHSILYLCEKMVPFDSPIPSPSASKLTLSDTMATPNDDNPETRASGDDILSMLNASVKELGPTEQEIICRRFGLNGYAPTTLENVGAKLGMTRERVRQIQLRALASMQGKFIRCGITSLDMSESDILR